MLWLGVVSPRGPIPWGLFVLVLKVVFAERGVYRTSDGITRLQRSRMTLSVRGSTPVGFVKQPKWLGGRKALKGPLPFQQRRLFMVLGMFE